MLIIGASSGGILAATGIAGLAALKIGRHLSSAEKVRSAAKSKALAVLTQNQEFEHVNRDRLMAILSMDTVPISQSDLIEACKSDTDNNLGAALARRILATVPLSDDDDELTKRSVYLILEAGMNACVAAEEFNSRLSSVLLPHIVQVVGSLKLLIEQTQDRSRELRLSDELFIGLARKYSDTPNNIKDIDQARRELERALELGSEIQARNALPPNTEDAVEVILAKVHELNQAGKIDEAADFMDDEIERQQKVFIRTYDARIEQSILARDYKAACDFEFRKMALLTPKPQDQFNALLGVLGSWYDRGESLGLNFDLEVAIELAREGLRRFPQALLRAKLLTMLGCALQVHGDRDSDSVRLRQAVTTHNQALTILWQHREMNEWAKVHNNLGNAYLSLGSRENGVASLKLAMASHLFALPFRSRVENEYDWAMTQNNLGTTLRNLGERSVTASDSEKAFEYFGKAETALRSSLEVRTFERNRIEWSMTQGNLGSVLCNLGFLTNDPLRFEEAERLQQEIIDHYVQKDEPLLWAKAQHNHGITLRQWGEQEAGTEKLDRATIAFTAALEERTVEQTPLEWAKTQDNLALTELAYACRADTSNVRSHLEKALAHVEEALRVYSAQATPFNHRQALVQREHTLSCMARHQLETTAL